MVNIKFNDKFYTFAMNAQTGEFVGNIPVDKKRAVLYGLGILIVVIAIVVLIGFIAYSMRGA